jgi:hypothetical protein
MKIFLIQNLKYDFNQMLNLEFLKTKLLSKPKKREGGRGNGIKFTGSSNQSLSKSCWRFNDKIFIKVLHYHADGETKTPLIAT